MLKSSEYFRDLIRSVFEFTIQIFHAYKFYFERFSEHIGKAVPQGIQIFSVIVRKIETFFYDFMNFKVIIYF